MAAISDSSLLNGWEEKYENGYPHCTHRRDDGSQGCSYSSILSVDSWTIGDMARTLTKFSKLCLCNSRSGPDDFTPENLNKSKAKAKAMARKYLAKLGTCCIGCGQELRDSEEIIKNPSEISFNVHKSDECMIKAIPVYRLTSDEMAEVQNEVEVARCILAIKASVAVIYAQSN